MSNFEEVLEEHHEAIATCLLTFLISTFENRAAVKRKAPTSDLATVFNEMKRSSMNDICGFAHQLGRAYFSRKDDEASEDKSAN